MEGSEKKEKEKKKKDKPKYEAPKIKSYSGDDLLKELGPAQAIYGNNAFP